MDAAALLLSFLGTLGSSPQSDTGSTQGSFSLFAGTRCEREVSDLLDAWHARVGKALAEAPGPTGTRAARISTEELGVWARLRVDAGGEPFLERVTDGAAKPSGLGRPVSAYREAAKKRIGEIIDLGRARRGAGCGLE